MSVWTHVAGVVRIDALRIPGVFSDSRSRIEERIQPMPAGSEGPLSFFVYENEIKSSLSAFTLTFFGDLRDYDLRDEQTEKELRKWFALITKGGMIRQAVMHVDCEPELFKRIIHRIHDAQVEEIHVERETDDA